MYSVMQTGMKYFMHKMTQLNRVEIGSLLVQQPVPS